MINANILYFLLSYLIGNQYISIYGDCNISIAFIIIFEQCTHFQKENTDKIVKNIFLSMSRQR